jgi:hypothetical protein
LNLEDQTMNIKSTKCHTPKPSWGPVYDVSKSLPTSASTGPTVLDLGSAIETYVAQAEAGGSVQNMHPYCVGVDTDTAVRASENLKEESQSIQGLFEQANPQEVLLSAQDVADVLDRHAVEFGDASSKAAEEVESLTASAKKSLGLQLGASAIGGGIAIAMGVAGVPGWIPAIIGGAAVLGAFDAGMNFTDENLGSEALRDTRYDVDSFAREAEASGNLGATAQAWADHLNEES